MNGKIVLTEEQVLEAIAGYVDSSFANGFEITGFRPIYTGENKGSFEADWSED